MPDDDLIPDDVMEAYREARDTSDDPQLGGELDDGAADQHLDAIAGDARDVVDEAHVHDADQVAAYADLPVNPRVDVASTADGSIPVGDWAPAMPAPADTVDDAPSVDASRANDAPPAARDRTSALDAALDPQIGLDLGLPHDRRPTVRLTDRFVVPPFTTLDSRQAYWKERKRAWLGLGIQSELGRAGTLTYQTDTVLDPDFYRKKEEAEATLGRRLTLDEFRRDHYRGLDAPPTSIQNTGTSIFDPVLCEVAYRWFSPPGGVVVDPFAGGSVRGVVASILGRRYAGVELREEQVSANRRNAGEVVGPESSYDFGGETPMPTYVVGDATQLRALELPAADLIFTCPPYADLEVYSDDPRDLSTAPYPTFRAMLASVMAQSVEVLRDDRFAVWVVGEARDRGGFSYGIVADTVRAGLDAGLRLYNEAILETAIASAAMRATKQVVTSRKLVRVHQHVLVFVKGDPRRAAAACGDPTEVGG